MYFCMCILSGKGSWTYLKLNFLRVLTLSAPTPQNGQTQAMCLTIVFGWRVKG